MQAIPWQSLQCGSKPENGNFERLAIYQLIAPIGILLAAFFFLYLPLATTERIKAGATEAEIKAERARVRRRSRFRGRIMRCLLFTVFLIYPSSSSTVIRLYACRTVEGVRYLLADFNSLCDSEIHLFYEKIGLIFVFIYPIGSY